MSDFDSGVAKYVIATCTIKVGFPVNHKGEAFIACKYCRYLSYNEKYCNLNGELVFFADRYISDKCPLKFESEDK